MPRHEALGLLHQPLRTFTKQTVTSTKQLEKTIDKIASGGFGYDREEYEEGICAIALPIRSIGASNYAMALSMPSKRFAERLPQLRGALRTVQQGIEKSLRATYEQME